MKETAGVGPAAPLIVDAARDDSVNTRLRRRRIECGLSPRELASRVGLSNGRYAGIENGCQRPPSLERARMIAAALNVRVAAVFDVSACECGCGAPTLGLLLPGHHARLPQHGETVRRGHQARRARLGIPEQKTCERCGVTFTRSDAANQSDAHWRQRRFCSNECKWPGRVEERVCALEGCDRTFKPSYRLDPRRRHCSRSHAGRDLWREGRGAAPKLVEYLPGAARRRFKTRWSPKPGRPRAETTIEPETLARIAELRRKKWGRPAIVTATGLKDSTVRAILSRLP